MRAVLGDLEVSWYRCSWLMSWRCWYTLMTARRSTPSVAHYCACWTRQISSRVVCVRRSVCWHVRLPNWLGPHCWETSHRDTARCCRDRAYHDTILALSAQALSIVGEKRVELERATDHQIRPLPNSSGNAQFSDPANTTGSKQPWLLLPGGWEG